MPDMDHAAVGIPAVALDAGEEGRRDDAGPKIPPQHQRVTLADFTLVRTLGTGMSLITYLSTSFIPIYFCTIHCALRMRRPARWEKMIH
jgi:hypothetical protein